VILIDTSVWIDYFHGGAVALDNLLSQKEVVMHEFVIGEVAAGNLSDRQRTLSAMSALPALQPASHAEVFGMVEMHRLYGRGLSWIDLHLLAAAKIARVRLWSVDGTLAAAAHLSGIAYLPGRI